MNWVGYMHSFTDLEVSKLLNSWQLCRCHIFEQNMDSTCVKWKEKSWNTCQPLNDQQVQEQEIEGKGPDVWWEDGNVWKETWDLY